MSNQQLSNQQLSNRSDFMSPRSRYRGQFKPENLLFNANLQEFAQRVMIISNLETGGKISPEASYEEIKSLWKNLKNSKRSLGIGQRSPFDRSDNGETEAS